MDIFSVILTESGDSLTTEADDLLIEELIMGYGVGASGFVGIAPETTSGTYVPPTYFLNLRSESLKYVQEPLWRRLLRGTADVSGVMAGNTRVEGALTVEIIEDGLVQLLKAARGTITKTGTVAPWTYVYAPNQVAVPSKTLSITVVRNGVAFGYTGCVVSSLSMTTDNGLLVGTFNIIGNDEANQTVPTAAFSTILPYSTNHYSIEIPTATQVFTVENFTFTLNDNAAAQYRLKNTGLGAQFVKFGERSVELAMNKDFLDRTEFDAFKALTAKSVSVKASKSANQSVQITVPVAILDTYDISGLSGQADLIMASVKYTGVNSGTGAVAITVVSDQDIPIP